MTSGDADYEIRARIVAEDASTPGVRGVEKKLDGLERKAGNFGSVLGASFGKAMAFLGGTAGVGMIVKGMIGLNSEIESATNGMATLFSAFTGAPIDQSLGRAKGILGDLRKDAKAGVGELTNYTEGFQRIYGATGGAVDDQTIRELTRNSLAAAFAMDPTQGLQLAALDVSQALNSGVNTDTPYVARALQSINFSADKFNKLKPAEKIETLNRAFASFAPGVELMGKSWSAQFSTLTDNVKETIRTVSQPLFERWSEQLRDVNDWLAANEDRIASIATDWGEKLVALWDHLIERARTYAAIAGTAGVLQTVGPTASSAITTGGKAAGLLGAGGLLGGSALASMGLVVGVVALVAGGFAALWTALQDYPELLIAMKLGWDLIQGSFGHLSETVSILFEELTGFRPALSAIGYVIAAAIVGFILGVDLMIRAVDTVALAFATFFKRVRLMAMAIYALARGDVAGARALMTVADRVGVAAEDRMRETWRGAMVLQQGGDLAGVLGAWNTEEGAAADGAGTTPPVQKPGDQNNNFNGPITIMVKAEVNEDPARVAIAFEEVIDNFERYRRGPRRAPKPPRI